MSKDIDHLLKTDIFKDALFCNILHLIMWKPKVKTLKCKFYDLSFLVKGLFNSRDVRQLKLSVAPSLAEKDIHIVTGADYTHGYSLLNLLESISNYASEASVTIWDLGLHSDQRAIVESKFPSYFLRTFDFSQYPDFVNISNFVGQYAWKPLIIEMTLFECRGNGIGIWLDAGDLVTGSLKEIQLLTLHFGFFSPYSTGRIIDWTHPETLHFLNLPSSSWKKPNCNGAIVSFDLSNENAMNLLSNWSASSLIVNCIAPEGSGRHNHRQDQSVLSVLAENANLNFISNSRILKKSQNILIHQDSPLDVQVRDN